MTAQDLMAALVRRWYIVVLGAAVTVAVLWPTTHRPGVYWTQLTVVLVPPSYELFPNKLENPQYSLGPLAGVIVSDFNAGNTPLLTASAETTLYGEGEQVGVQVRVPNEGNQWTPYYASPTIDIQVVDSTPEAVSARAEDVAAHLATLLEQRQVDLGVVPTMRATTITAPSTPSVYYISGSRIRAAGAVSILGLSFTILCVHWLERSALGRPRSRAAHGLAPSWVRPKAKAWNAAGVLLD